MRAMGVAFLGFSLVTTVGQAAIQLGDFGKTSAGEPVRTYTIKNKNGVTLKLTNLGARILEMHVPDASGKLDNVTLSLPTVAAYEKHDAHFGGTVGRYANRIAKGKFAIDGKTYRLATNNAPNHLHGGVKGFDSVVWKAREVKNGVEFSYQSKDGEEGYPGNLDVKASYSLDDSDQLKMEYAATTDKPTVVNLTNHAYWNLGGVGSGSVLKHELTIAADEYLPVDGTSIPLEPQAVKGTRMDFTQARPIERDYDHCYVLRNQTGQLALAARVIDPKSRRGMEVWTTEPGVQLYLANFLDGTAKNGGHRKNSAFCLETQHYPDSPNRPTFPSTLLRPGETYQSTTLHKFFVEKAADIRG